MIKHYSMLNLTLWPIGVEKNNDVAKHCYFSSNKHDPCREVMRTESRQESLRSHQRQKRPYEKHDSDYWSSGIKEQSKRKRSLEMDS